MTELERKEAAASAAAPRSGRAERIGYGVFAAAGLLVFILIIFGLGRVLSAADLAALVERRGPAVLGVPAAVAFALFLLGAVRAIDGPIRFDILGLKAEGSCAAAIIWIAIFLAVTLSVRALW